MGASSSEPGCGPFKPDDVGLNPTAPTIGWSYSSNYPRLLSGATWVQVPASLPLNITMLDSLVIDNHRPPAL